MEREYWLKAERIGFSKWCVEDFELAKLLWGNPEVTRLICASGSFSEEEIQIRLSREIENGEKYGIQYWPFFELETNVLIGCCGLRPRADKEYEIGFHLRPEFWGKGYAQEAANEVIRYGFTELGADRLFAGHNPKNVASKKVLEKLGFQPIGEEFYEPTGLMHPAYEMCREEFFINKDFGL